MSARENILNRPKGLPLPVLWPAQTPEEDRGARKILRKLVADFAHPDIFEFVWNGSGIHMDEEHKSFYPVVEQWEIEEAQLCPVPHERVWLETDVIDPVSGKTVQYCWLIRRDAAKLMAFTGWPLAVRDGTLIYFGAAIRMNCESDKPGDPETGGTVFGQFASYAKENEMDEFYDHLRLLLRFFRLLTLPEVRGDTFVPSPRLNRKRVERGLAPLATRRTVTIDPSIERSIYRPRLGQQTGPRCEHFRRAHTRRIRSGRVVQVRNCVVNRGNGSARPQTFRVH